MPHSMPASPTASRDDRIRESVWTLHYHLTRTRPICRRLIWAPCRPSAHAAEGLFVLWSSAARRPLVVGDFFCPFFDLFSGLQLSPLISFSQAKGSGGHSGRWRSKGAIFVEATGKLRLYAFQGGKKVTVYFICACICNLVLCLYWRSLEKGPSGLLAGLITLHHVFREFLQQVVINTFGFFFLFFCFLWAFFGSKWGTGPASTRQTAFLEKDLISVCAAFRGRIGLAAKKI